MKSQIYFPGILRDSFADTVKVLPLPLGPIHNTFVSLIRRCSINVTLRTLFIVGTSISARLFVEIILFVIILLILFVAGSASREVPSSNRHLRIFFGPAFLSRSYRLKCELNRTSKQKVTLQI